MKLIHVISLIMCLTVSMTSKTMQQTLRTDGMSQQIAFSLNFAPNQMKRGLTQPQQVSDLELIKHEVSTWSLNPQNFFSKKLIFVTAATLLAAYAWLCHECVQANHFFKCPECWVLWRADWPYQVIANMPPEQLAHDLVIEMQQRYGAIDCVQLCDQFVSDIDQELAQVVHFAKIISAVRWINLKFLFPLDRQIIDQLDAAQKRLPYLKQIVLSHVATDQASGCLKKSCLIPDFGD